MRLKTKPEKPRKRKEKIIEFFDVEYASLKDLINWADSFKVKYEDISFNRTYKDYDYEATYAEFSRHETDEEFQLRLDDYKRQLDKYNQWYKGNEKAIEEEKSKRIKTAIERQKRVIKNEQKNSS